MKFFESSRRPNHIPGHREHRSRSPWKKAEEPQRILVTRFHAIGDVALTLPACAALRERYPDARIDLLTSESIAPLATAIRLFTNVHRLRQHATKHEELNELLSLGLSLRHVRYEVVLDLQRNWKSRWVRRIIRPESWGEFDRFSIRPACERTLCTFHEAGFNNLGPVFAQKFLHAPLQSAHTLLEARGWRPGDLLVVLNPAGLWETRHWPLPHYVQLARALQQSRRARFLLIGTGRISMASRFLVSQLGDVLIDLSGHTSLDVAFALLDFVDLAVTEDSGLMHMAWSLGIPQVILFGSSRHYWSLPTGEHVHAFHSGDLTCGACMQPRCRYGDTHCLARVTPEAVLQAAEKLLATHQREHTGQ